MPRAIEKLAAAHDLSAFDCGVETLNVWLRRFAFSNQNAGSAQTWVAVEDGRVVGFYSLAVAQIAHEDAGARVAKGMPRHPIPVMLLARLGIALTEQGRGLGSGLLKDAILRTLQAAEIAGIRALLVHAKDESPKRFYEHFGFIPSPTDPLHLLLLLKDARRIAGS